MDTSDRLAALLRDRGAERIEHPGGTLAAHLERVQLLLARLGAGPDLQLAGRAHAVYGTDGFDVRLLADDERPLLVEIIGPAAEELVHRYGGCDRDRTWPDLAATGLVHDRRNGQAERLEGPQLRDFADLSLGNELDVAGHAPGFVEQHGGYFRRLTEAWAPVLSPAVLAEARRVLG
ncbi:DUF6817 domain-containing protein [Blastococcus xanthinilyticus]|uniref:DUF6817 domain-containing protein n=1 Tax=Blastococcus xanthinilyticus TaxID=1564164 RepID=A0A5S5CW32_9ACTN|nr:hypothetical protein [Blastococcus xanthinilyticus]TYP86762.1 hypothetical protein BD833_10847 [Blastococcus xanthinilyticus]